MPATPLDYEPAGARRESPQRTLARAGKIYLVLYLVAVASLAGVNLWLGVAAVGWAEVFYGPAITVGGCFGLFAVGVWMDWRRNRRRRG